jgi:hypothetical protein
MGGRVHEQVGEGLPEPQLVAPHQRLPTARSKRDRLVGAQNTRFPHGILQQRPEIHGVLPDHRPSVADQRHVEQPRGEIAKQARLVDGAVDVALRLPVDRPARAALDQLHVVVKRRERRLELVARRVDEALLEVAQAAVGDVADDDDAAPLAARRVARRLIPAALATGWVRPGERHRERFAA